MGKSEKVKKQKSERVKERKSAGVTRFDRKSPSFAKSEKGGAGSSLFERAAIERGEAC